LVLKTTKDPALAGGVDVRFVFDWFRRYWLALWFTMWAAAWLATKPGAAPFFDGQLYLDATRAWLAGGDPWMVSVAGEFFAAPPPTLLVMAPFALLPDGLYVLVATLVLAAVLTVRMLGLPWWWLLFPPLLEGVWSANIHIWLIPLLLTRAAPVAVFAKVYAVVPLVFLGRWRAQVATGALFLVTVPILPWATFIADLPAIAGYFGAQSHYALPLPVLLALAPFGLAALWLVGRERAGWMAVPAFAGYQWYYTTFVMATRSPVAAALAAVPVAGSGMLALLGLAMLRTWSARSSATDRAARLSRSRQADRPSPASSR
jgi:hypothetical protein